MKNQSGVPVDDRRNLGRWGCGPVGSAGFWRIRWPPGWCAEATPASAS